MPDSKPQFSTDLDVWCEKDHDPKLLEGEGECRTCPECGQEYLTNSRVAPVGDGDE